MMEADGLYDDFNKAYYIGRTHWYICSKCQQQVPPPVNSITIPGGRVWMGHCATCGNIQSVQITDGRRAWWVAKADAEIGSKLWSS